MSDNTHTSHGSNHRGKRFPIFQAALVVRCKTCQKDHRLLVTSDDRDMVEGHIDALVRVLRLGGYDPIAALWESYHPGTDLNFRDTDAFEEALETARHEAPDQR